MMERALFAGCLERQSATLAAQFRIALLDRLMGGATPCRIFDVIKGYAPGIPLVHLALIMSTVTTITVGCLASVGHARVALAANAMMIPTALV
jgi:hypothetical protein